MTFTLEIPYKPPMVTQSSPFRSFLMGGFESATMVFEDGRRVDAIASVEHDKHAFKDYAMLKKNGISTIRDSLRWHIIEKQPYKYDWSSFVNMLRASLDADVQIIWDLCHFGFPEDINPWSLEFIDRFRAFATEAAVVFQNETNQVPFWCPINEISFWSYAGGEHGHFMPLGIGRGHEWKQQMVRASIAAMNQLRNIDPRARFMHSDPVIHVTAPEQTYEAITQAENMRVSMFKSWDMIGGYLEPELGGKPEYLDIIGVNFYPSNQFTTDEETVGFGQLFYRPFEDILMEVWERYQKPILIAETGAEGANGAAWLRYVSHEYTNAIHQGALIQGCCIYPVMDYVGWTNNRHCRCGLIELDEDLNERRYDIKVQDTLKKMGKPL